MMSYNIYEIRKSSDKISKSIDNIVDIFTDYIYDSDESGFNGLRLISAMYNEIMNLKEERNRINMQCTLLEDDVDILTDYICDSDES